MRVQADVFDITHRRLRIPSSGIHNVQQRKCLSRFLEEANVFGILQSRPKGPRPGVGGGGGLYDHGPNLSNAFFDMSGMGSYIPETVWVKAPEPRGESTLTAGCEI